MLCIIGWQGLAVSHTQGLTHPISDSACAVFWGWEGENDLFSREEGNVHSNQLGLC